MAKLMIHYTLVKQCGDCDFNWRRDIKDGSKGRHCGEGDFDIENEDIIDPRCTLEDAPADVPGEREKEEVRCSREIKKEAVTIPRCRRRSHDRT